MTVEEFRTTLSRTEPPPASPPVLALWHDARGDWRTAHEIAQSANGATGAWVHAYLHRKEGDLANARYWYRQAGRPESTDSPDAEWEHIVGELLAPAWRPRSLPWTPLRRSPTYCRS
jgi:hypothetical protein